MSGARPALAAKIRAQSGAFICRQHRQDIENSGKPEKLTQLTAVQIFLK